MDTQEPQPAIRSDRSGIGWHTVAFLCFYYALAAASGALQALQREELYFLLTVSSVVNLGVWAVLDARRRGKPIPLLAQWVFVLLAGFVVPVYVVFTHKWRGLGWVALHFVGMYVTIWVTFAAVGAALYGAEWLRSVEWLP